MNRCPVVWNDEVGCLPGRIEHHCTRLDTPHSRHWCICSAEEWRDDERRPAV